MSYSPLSSSLLALLTFASPALIVACSSSDDGGASPPNVTSTQDSGAPSPVTCALGATRCEPSGLISTCNAAGSFDAPAECADEGTCRAGTTECAPPSAKQLAQAKELASMLTYVRENTSWHGAIDWDKLRDEGRKTILHGDESDLTYFTALFNAFITVPEGHQGLYLTGAGGCGKLVPYASLSQRGACGRPHAKGVIVTAVKDGSPNPLALKKGDIITSVTTSGASGTTSTGVTTTSSGADLLTSLAARPICTASRPSTSFRDAATAGSFYDLLAKGEEVTIESADGTSRKVVMPDLPLPGKLDTAVTCSDPFSRNMQVPVESEIRPDGIGVIRLPGFTDPEQPFPSGNITQQQLDTYRATFTAKIKAAFDKVKSAPGIVWDIRGNGGGLTLVGLEIASGMPGAKTPQVSYCQARIPKSDPPAFYSDKYVPFTLDPTTSQFTYTGKVAVITEGMNYSAADYFPLFVKSRTDAKLIGAPTAGAFGASSANQQFKGPPPFMATVDLNRCASADDDSFLEGKSIVPHVAVDYDAKDLAANIDTVLERAVAEVK